MSLVQDRDRQVAHCEREREGGSKQKSASSEVTPGPKSKRGTGKQGKKRHSRVLKMAGIQSVNEMCTGTVS